MQIREVAGVTIAGVAGACTGAEFERAIAADLRIAAADATFGARAVADVSACARRLTRLLGEAGAKEIVLAARTIDAARARSLGLVTRVVPAAALPRAMDELAQALAALPPLAVAAVGQAVRAVRDLTPAAALALEHAHFRRLLDTDDHRAAVRAFFDRRPATFRGR